ncbi:C4BPA protein, partial [Certhia familiaris]|nr:C4BPA protein [Certhia familiaris]
GGCGTPTPLLFAELSEEYENQTEFPVGMTVNYTCRAGYMEQPQISPTITCLENLTWSEAQEFCKRKQCKHPEPLRNGRVVVLTDLLLGSTVSHTCDQGYRLLGKEEISCDIKNGGVDWSGTLPYCEKIPCEPPPKIANGDYEERASYVYQSSVTYRCQDVPRGSDPFSLIGTATIFCTADADSNGVWSGPPPECRVVKCKNPEVENGKKTSGFGYSYSYKDSVGFECDQGYVMVGARVITCEENNTWVPPEPTCEEGVCPAPEILNGFLIPGKAAYGRGESVQIRCNSGCSFPDGSAEVTVTCQEQSSWGALQPCTCEAEGSGSTPVINYGRVTAGQKSSYSVGDFITIECYTGYTLHGEAQIQYIGGNQWVPAVPTCQLSKY